MSEFIRIPDQEYNKIYGQFRMQLNGVFQPFNTYGLHIFIPGAIETIVALAELAGERVRGKDTPITIEHANRRIRRKK